MNLTNGPGSYAGRVEVKYNGSWGQVCDYGINMNFGHVICRQLGYPHAIATPCYNAFGQGNTHYWMTNVRCKGNESSLAECDYTWGKAGCSMGLKGTVGVVCERSNMTVSKFVWEMHIFTTTTTTTTTSQVGMSHNAPLLHDIPENGRQRRPSL